MQCLPQICCHCDSDENHCLVDLFMLPAKSSKDHADSPATSSVCILELRNKEQRCVLCTFYPLKLTVDVRLTNSATLNF